MLIDFVELQIQLSLLIKFYILKLILSHPRCGCLCWCGWQWPGDPPNPWELCKVKILPLSSSFSLFSLCFFLLLPLTFSPAQVSSGRPDSYRVSRELLTPSAFSTQSCRGSPQQPRAQRAREEGQQPAQQQQQQQAPAPLPLPPPRRRTFH